MTEYAAYGAALNLGDGAGVENFTAIAQCSNISGPGLEVNVLDVTSHDSPNGWREKIAGLKDGGEVTLTIHYDPANATHDATTGLLDEFRSGRVSNYQMVFPDAASTMWEFAALVSRFEPRAPVDGALTADVRVTITGEPTLA